MLRWVTATHSQRYHAHDHTSGEGHVDQARFKSSPVADHEHFLVVCRHVERDPLRARLVERADPWQCGSLWRWMQKSEPEPKLLAPWPIARTPNWIQRVHQPLTEGELAAVRTCVQRGRPFGDDSWVREVAQRRGLEYTLRRRGRPRKHHPIT